MFTFLSQIVITLHDAHISRGRRSAPRALEFRARRQILVARRRVFAAGRQLRPQFSAPVIVYLFVQILVYRLIEACFHARQRLAGV